MSFDHTVDSSVLSMVSDLLMVDIFVSENFSSFFKFDKITFRNPMGRTPGNSLCISTFNGIFQCCKLAYGKLRNKSLKKLMLGGYKAKIELI